MTGESSWLSDTSMEPPAASLGLMYARAWRSQSCLVPTFLMTPNSLQKPRSALARGGRRHAGRRAWRSLEVLRLGEHSQGLSHLSSGLRAIEKCKRRKYPARQEGTLAEV